MYALQGWDGAGAKWRENLGENVGKCGENRENEENMVEMLGKNWASRYTFVKKQLDKTWLKNNRELGDVL